MQFDLNNKTALITGGSRGIGKAVALTLADHGMNIAFCGRTVETLEATATEIRSRGVQAYPFQADVSQRDDIDKLVENTLQHSKHIDVLVNNAVTSTSARFDELTDDEFQYHIDVKLMAYIRVARKVLQTMADNRSGRIVNVGGMTARIVAPLRMTNGVVNAGVANFTKQFANYAAQHNVTVNCVHPGYTATERVTQIFEREAVESNSSVEAVIEKRVNDIPLGKLIKPEDIAASVLFFCSPLADMVTGQCIAVDGGSGQSINY